MRIMSQSYVGPKNKSNPSKTLTLSALKVSINFSSSSGGRKSPIKCLPLPISVKDSAHSGGVKTCISLYYINNLNLGCRRSEFEKPRPVSRADVWLYRGSFPSPSFGGDAPRYQPCHPPLHRCHIHVGDLLWPFPISAASLPLHACASWSFHTFLASTWCMRKHYRQKEKKIIGLQACIIQKLWFDIPTRKDGWTLHIFQY